MDQAELHLLGLANDPLGADLMCLPVPSAGTLLLPVSPITELAEA